MNLLGRRIQTFVISNIVVSFAITGFTGARYLDTGKEVDISSNEEISLEAKEDPLSHIGDIIYEKVEGIVKQKESQKKVTSVVTGKQYTNTVTYAPAVYNEVTGNAVVLYAKRYLGLRYVSGGYSLSTGTDCSGFTKLIYQEFGVSLSRSAGGQAYNGTYVRKADLQKGDLVFYSNGNGVISHVGIYIGGGQVLHESNPRDGVKISSVNMMQYITARRVINSTAIKIAEEKKAREEASNNNDIVSSTDSDANIVEEDNNIDESNIIVDTSNNTDVLTETQEETKKEESNTLDKEIVTDTENQE